MWYSYRLEGTVDRNHSEPLQIPCYDKSTWPSRRNSLLYTEWLRRKGQYFWRWYYWSLWEKKKVHMSLCVILNVHRYRAVWISGTNSVRFCSLVWIHETNCSHLFWMLLSTLRKVKLNSDEQNATFAHESQSTLKLTLEFLNVYHEV
jgi:hypothetical protein